MKLITSIFKWVLLFPIEFIGKVLTVIFAPITSYLSMGGDALPKYLRWMQTHDNSIDALWQQPRHMLGYSTLKGIQPEWFAQSSLLRWYARTLWLIRNPAYGLAYIFGYESNGNPNGTVVTEHGIWDSGSTNWKISKWDGAWQIKAQIFYPFFKNRFLRVYIGWKSVSGLSRLMLATHINPFRKYHPDR